MHINEKPTLETPDPIFKGGNLYYHKKFNNLYLCSKEFIAGNRPSQFRFINIETGRLFSSENLTDDERTEMVDVTNRYTLMLMD